MKKLLLAIVVLATSLFLVSCSKKERLELYLPNEYINTDLVKAFEKENGVRVKISTFDNNEMALGLLKKESFDLVIPSDYAIEELATEGFLEKLDYKEILGADFEFAPGLQSFLDQLKVEGFDFLEYGIPYFWGTVGILYNHNNKVITNELLTEKGFGIIGDERLKTVLYDSSRDAYLAGLLNVNDGVLLKDAKQADIDKATTWLQNTTKQENTVVLSDEILDEMITGTKYDAVITYSGDATFLMEENDNYSYFIPENTNVWADGFVIPKNAKNKELAKEFIKFMSTHDSALANTEEIGYTTIRKDVFTELTTGTGAYATPRLKMSYEANVAVFQNFRYDNDLKKMISDGWSKVIANL